MVTATMKIKRHLLLGRKIMTNLDSILKSSDFTLPTKIHLVKAMGFLIVMPTKVHLVKAMGFLIVMYGCESWSIKKAEC